MLSSTKRASLAALGLAAALGLGACGGGGDDEVAEEGRVAAQADAAALRVEADESASLRPTCCRPGSITTSVAYDRELACGRPAAESLTSTACCRG